MILGLAVTGPMMVVIGVVLLVLTVFQVLVGLRRIKLGRSRMGIHKWTGVAILVLGVVHGLMGVAFGLGLTIL